MAKAIFSAELRLDTEIGRDEDDGLFVQMQNRFVVSRAHFAASTNDAGLTGPSSRCYSWQTQDFSYIRRKRVIYSGKT